MEEWMRQPVSHLKRLVKSRAGRIAELQMEIKILEGIIDRKVASGDLGGSVPRESKSQEPKEQAKPQESNPGPEKAQVKTEPEPASQETQKQETEQTKITQKSSTHAFEEID